MISNENIKTYLEITDSSQDSLIAVLKSKAIGYAESYIWYKLEAPDEAITEYVDINGYQAFLTPYQNISISALQKNAWTKFEPSWENVDKYYFNEDLKAIELPYEITAKKYLKATLTYWYASSGEETPNDLKGALLEIIWAFFSANGEKWRLKAETVDWDRTEFWENKVPNSALLILDKYKAYGIQA